ncbi:MULTISPECIES: class D sortase [Clostridium]|uniref:Class D sortase n=1 Tax=Clostridium cadaveris TaxID=1529 RepID=A0A1I2PFT6_9CLOT|nr:class D sortase [Clostridium cadaveris]MDU4953122.1 class D sortase [Clostridium sp.]MDM8311720.1 class D sortase [Clostridium cadaveris]NME63486.1 class D sortase [Clostridium cadaveris]NWK09758.1 class D sortase [Clostridium cadaveris]PWL51400.1 MAG: class D sortase [Clostridium cadaveris]
MKDKKKVFGIVLVVIGLLVIIISAGIKINSMNTEKRLREEYEQALNDLQKGTDEQGESDSKLGFENEDVNAIGIMVIPKINVKVLVTEGTEDEKLKYYVGHFENTALPGEKGNFAVAGHRNYIYNEMFRDVNQLEQGDDIIVRTAKGEFTYKVKEQKVIEPTDVQILDPTDDATVTLVTCTIGGKQRLIVTGELEK